jgi:predicted NAD/FAD-binding protein
MTFSVSRDHGVFEWAGDSLARAFCQPSRLLLDPSMWMSVYYDILRFNAYARELVVDNDNYLEDCSIAEYLVREVYSDTFRSDLRYRT